MPPDDPSHFRNEIVRRSEGLLRRRQLDEARQSLLPLIAMAPEDADAHLRIGAILVRQKKAVEGAAALGCAVALAPFRAGARLHYAHALNSIRRHDEALRHFALLLALKPNTDQGHRGRGEAFLALDHVEDAAASCARAGEIAPMSHEAMFLLGHVEARRSRTDAAISAFQRALRLKPGSGATVNRLGLQYLRTDRLHEAVAAFSRLRALAPQNAEGHLQWGLAMAKFGRFDDAVHALEKSRLLHPTWALPRLELWRNLVRMRRFSEALALLHSSGDLTASMALNRRDAFYTLDQTVRRAFTLGGLPKAIEQAGALVSGIAAQAASGPPLDSISHELLRNAAATAPESALDGAARAILAGDWRSAFSCNAAWIGGDPQSIPAKYATTLQDGPHQGHPLWHLLSPFYHFWIGARGEDSGRAVQHRWAATTNVFDSTAPVDDLLAAVTSIVDAHRPFITALSSQFAGKRVIDIGCGRGEWLYILGRDLGMPIDGLLGCDLHEGRVRSARELLSHLSRSQNFDADRASRLLARNLFVADLLALPTAELVERCGRVDLAFLSRITMAFDDDQLDRVIGKIAALGPSVIAEVCPIERWSYAFGRSDLAPYFSRHGYRAVVHGWLPETATAETLRYLALPRKYWVATRYYIFERVSD